MKAKPKFTADDVIRVYRTRWLSQRIANDALRHLKPLRIMRRYVDPVVFVDEPRGRKAVVIGGRA